MSRFLPTIGSFITKFAGRAVDGSKTSARIIGVATLSVAETLVGILDSGIVCDIRRVKESLIRKMESEADDTAAEAQRKLAEAAEAASRADLPKRRDAFAMIERRRREAEVAKTEAEAEAILMDAETRRSRAIAEARAKWLEALSKLRQEGGEVFLSRENLEGILRLGLPPPEPEPRKDKPK